MDYKQYIIIVLVLLIIAFSIIKLNKKNVHIEMNKLINLLGGIDNIISSEQNESRFKVTLKDVTKVNKEEIIALGAKGIVEIDNQLKIILGENSKRLKSYIDNIK